MELAKNNTLKNIHLNDWDFDEDNIRFLDAMIYKNQSIEEINLGNCNLNDYSIKNILPGLMKNTSL